MHEMSVASSLFDLALEEMKKRGCERLTRVVAEYGDLAGIMPEALSLCFELLARETQHKDAELELIRLPLRLRCPDCGARFGGQGKDALWEPCPECGESFGHIVEQGKELLLSRIEAI